MPTASIRSTVNSANPLTNVSRDDLVSGDVVTVTSVNTHTTYSWTIAYKPPSSTAVFSGNVLAQTPGSFTVDEEGPYLVRLTADLGLSTETAQYVRLRAVTVLGDLRLVAAGEGYGGSIPVPVDQTPSGWTDALNTNLTNLLGLIRPSVMSGRVVSVDPTEGHGDYQTIQAAIDAVSSSATLTTPYVVRVAPGLYDEDVTFAPHVHVIGWPGNYGASLTRVVVIRGAHEAPMLLSTDLLQLSHLQMENISPSVEPVLYTSGLGMVSLTGCEIQQQAVNPTQGPALLCEGGDLVLSQCTLTTNNSVPDDRCVLGVDGVANVTINNSSLSGPTGLVVDGGAILTITQSQITSSGATGVGFVVEEADVTLEYSKITSVSGTSIDVHPGAGALTGDVLVRIGYSSVEDVSFDITGITGTTSLIVDVSRLGTVSFPGGDPTVLSPTVGGHTVGYDPTTSGLTSTDVQGAIDEVVVLAQEVRTLDDAYDGGVPSSGSGRTIVADQGAVRISDAPSSSDPPPAGNTNGKLQVVGGVDVGAILAPEITVDPNPYGTGPSILMGNRVVPNNVPWGIGTASIQARSTGDPLYRNYNLRVQTESSDGGGEIGRVILRAGDGYDAGGTGPDGGDVFVFAGSTLDSAGGDAGNITLAPGRLDGGAPGHVRVVDPDSGTPATLTASLACADPIGVDGTVVFGTSTGAVSLTVAAADTRAAVVAGLDALVGISASESLGVITLTSEEEGPCAEIYFLSATTGLDAALGGFDGVPQTNGSYTRTIEIQVTADQEISFGINGSTGPMIYNADTGKLTVPGLIDPTGMIFEQAPAPTTGPTEGALFVSDGSSGLTAGSIYYVGPSSAPPTEVVSGGGGFTFPTATVPSQTAEGQAVWDTNDDALTVGDGVGRVTLIGDNTSAGGDLSGSYPNPTVTDLTLTGEVQGSVLYFDGANWVTLAPSTSGHVLQTNGAGSDPSWVAPAVGSGDVVGPASSTTDGLARFSDGTGKLLKDTALWTLTDAGILSGVSASLILPQGASAAPTTEGSLAWDTDDDLLKVGTGVGTKTLVDLDSTQTLSAKTFTSPTINGGTHTAITSLGVRSTGSGAHDLTVRNTENLSAPRILTLTVGDADRTLSMSGDMTVSGGYALSITLTGATTITLPVSGTLVSSATSAGGDLSGTYPNPTVVDLTISGEARGAVLYFDGSGWESLSPSTSGYFLRTNGAGADPTWALAGDVSGPASSTGDAVARFDGITGKILDTSTGWTLSDAGVLSGSSGSLTLPQGAAAAPTAEGSVAWDTDDDLLKVGTGAATLVMVDTTSTQTLSSKTLTAPTINGGTHTEITSLGLRSTGSGAFDLTIRNTENLSVGRALTLTVSDGDRLLSLSGDLILSGGFSTTLTTTATTNVTLPISGTLISSASAAGGDISGTYPNPTVSQARGLRETSGPTTLTMGAVADGQVLRRVGSTIVGVNLLAYLAIAGPLEAVLIPDGTATSTGTLV